MMKPEDYIIFDLIFDNEYESIALCAVGHKRKDLIESLLKMGVEVNVYDYAPYLNCDDYNQVDIIFDDIEFKEDVIVHCSQERTYPIGKVHKGDMILVCDKTPHNGSCTIYNTPEEMATDNNLELIEGTIVNATKVICYGYSL